MSHDVYVVDTGNDRVEEFSAGGVSFVGEFSSPPGGFSRPTGIAVDNSQSALDQSNGDVYVIDRNVIDKFSSTGVYQRSLTGVCENERESPPCSKSKFVPFVEVTGIAVSPSGELWVLDTPETTIYNFNDSSANEYLSERKNHRLGSSSDEGMAVDAETELFVNITSIARMNDSDEILLYPLCGEVKNSEVTPHIAFGVAGDWASKEIFVDNADSIGVCGLDGEALDGFAFNDFKTGPNLEYGGSDGLAVDEEGSGTVYASALAADKVFIYSSVVLPDVKIDTVSEQHTRSLTLNGEVNPEGAPVTRCEFEYVSASGYEAGAPDPYAKGTKVVCSPSAGGLGSGTGFVTVDAHLTGLTPETTYHYRLVAENAAHVISATNDRVVTAGPVLGGEYTTDVASDSATLSAPISPNGDDTHYYFEYGTSATYGSFAPVGSPGVDIGSSLEVEVLSWHLQGLMAGTTYHYRTVIVQDGEVFVEPDHVFVTQGAVGGPVLGDGRAWELVSPADKKGALIEPFANGIGDEIQAAANGDRITYLNAGPALGTGAQGKINWSQTLSVRVGGGWDSEDLTLPRRIPEGEAATSSAESPEYELFSPDLLWGVVTPPATGTPPLSPEAGERTIYLRENAERRYVPLVTPSNVPAETSFGGVNTEGRMYFVGASSDLSHVVLASPFALTPEAVDNYLPPNTQWNLYEWSGGRLQLVNILPEKEGGEPTRGPDPSVRLAGGNASEGNPTDVIPSAVSSDGRRIAWDLGVPRGSGYVGLFVRDMVEEKTVKVCGVSCVFQWMSADGSKVFYIENGNLFVFDVDSSTNMDLTADHGAGPGEENGGVQELVSDVTVDGSYVYFVARSVLNGATGAVSGGFNLYVLHDTGSEWTTSFVATLSGEDEKDWNRLGEEAGLSDLSGVSSRVSPDGRFLAFMSNRPLTGYDNTDAVSGHADEEVFLYDALSRRLVCASCDPTGARPVGVLDRSGSSLLVDRRGAWTGQNESSDPWLAGSVPGWDGDFLSGSRYQPRYLSDSGRLFFDGVDALVPQATNGVEDVYEFEPAGVGSCTKELSFGSMVYVESSGGCVGLMSSGVSSSESAFFDASENGNDIFFITAEKLVRADFDSGYDVYDSHVCGSEGVACVREPEPKPPCSSGDSCKAVPSPQPVIFGPAPSQTFSGTGNVIEETKRKAQTKHKKKHRRKRRGRTRRTRGGGVGSRRVGRTMMVGGTGQ